MAGAFVILSQEKAMQYEADEFYPTPPALIADMLSGVSLDSIGTILEPNAGKGDINKYLQHRKDKYSRKTLDIDAIELSPELRHILKGQEMRVVHDDFLTYDTFKRYDLVVMNPPFSNGDKHLLKALRFVIGGGKLVCVLNAETIRNPYTNGRRELVKRLEELHAVIDYRQNAFVSAENKTGVEIAIVRVDMPESGYDSVILDNLRQAEETRIPREEPDNPLVSNNAIRALVERYDHEARAGITLMREYTAVLKTFMTTEQSRSPILIMEIDDRKLHYTKNLTESVNDYLTAVRRRYWEALFTTGDFVDRLTSNVQSDLHSRVGEFAGYEFSLFNIYQLYIDLGQDLLANIKKTILDLFEDFTHRHSWTEYSNNIHYYSGWKTNEAFKINRKVIIPIYGSSDWNRGGDGQYRLDWGVRGKLCDIEKTFDYLAGNVLSGHRSLAEIIEDAQRQGQRHKVHFKHFTASFFQKGTCHLEFHDDRLVKKFNIFGAQQRGWLPPGYGTASYEELEPEAREVVESFEGKDSYRQTVANNQYFLVSDAPQSLLPLCG